MYFADFFRNLFKRSNVGVLIYLILNLLLLFFLSGQGDISGFFVVLGVYLFSLVVALSPVGEAILRIQQGCKPITRQDILAKVEPLFRRVYEKAKNLDPSIPDGVKIYLNNDKAPNAFATGRKTICITKGLLSLSDEQIESTLAHEFGHLAHKDTDMLLVISVGNLIVTFIFIATRLIINITGILFSIINRSIGGLIATFLVDILFGLAMWSWTKIGTLLVLYSGRKNEFEADEFAFKLGYGHGLAATLDIIAQHPPAHGLWKALYSTHPDTNDRIGKLQILGVEYSRY
ncbi:MAG: hypothetical protein A4E56_03211 [Pelotomaculum sp. PtaU1.Bin065]|nr:MAG: hypothetical protein A4E56_03211 [Pelotomaculum sp. PtaU1.Bin065]